jgi:putative redox protein
MSHQQASVANPAPAPLHAQRPAVSAVSSRGPSVTVTEIAGSRLAQSVRAGDHTFVADEPLVLGGDNSGPTPYDLLLAALGTCTSMTIRLYAERHGYPLERVAVRLRHLPRRANTGGSQDAAAVEGIEKVVELTGDLDDAQRARLLEIAERCPVHRTLLGSLEIATTAAFSDRTHEDS